MTHNVNDTATEVYTQKPASWTRQPRERKPMPEDLPSSKDGKFWNDGEVHTVRRDTLQTENKQDHYLEWVGPHAVCTTCPHPHTIPLDMTKYDLKDGKPIRKALDKQ